MEGQKLDQQREDAVPAAAVVFEEAPPPEGTGGARFIWMVESIEEVFAAIGVTQADVRTWALGYRDEQFMWAAVEGLAIGLGFDVYSSDSIFEVYDSRDIRSPLDVISDALSDADSFYGMFDVKDGDIDQDRLDNLHAAYMALKYLREGR